MPPYCPYELAVDDCPKSGPMATRLGPDISGPLISGPLNRMSDTPHGPRPGGFSGYACFNELRSRLKAVSPPPARMPGPRSRCLASRTDTSSSAHTRNRSAESVSGEDVWLQPPDASPRPLKRRGLRRAKARCRQIERLGDHKFAQQYLPSLRGGN